MSMGLLSGTIFGKRLLPALHIIEYRMAFELVDKSITETNV